MIDISLVQRIIEEEISPDFEIHEYFDTKPFVIIFWKHKEYDIDDERGQVVGPGPVIFDKQKNEYRLLGSGEWFYGDYADLLEPSEEDIQHRQDYDYLMGLLDGKENDKPRTDLLIEKIKQKIVKRQYVNTEEIDFLSILTGARRMENEIDGTFDIKREAGRNNALRLVFNHIAARQKLIEIWKEIGFRHEEISDTELILWKIKTGN
ncbi:MAG: hypothetical protein NTW29_03165 [Bacteroidetes bacterium]|nr:hypothetical protein [Bacteroidota bacterium]